MNTDHEDVEFFTVNEYSWSEMIRRCWDSMRSERRRLLLGVSMVGLIGLLMSLLPLYSKYVVDWAILERRREPLVYLTVAFLLLQGLRLFCWSISQRQLIHVRNVFLIDMRARCFRHLQNLCMRFHTRFTPAFLYEQIFGSSMLQIANLLFMIFNVLIIQLANLCFSLIFCMMLSPVMTAIILAGTLAYVFVGKRMGGIIKEHQHQCNQASNQVTDYLMDKIRGMQTVQAYTMEDSVFDSFQQRLHSMTMRYQKVDLTGVRLGLFTDALSVLLTIAVISGGGWMAINGGLAIGTFVAFLGYQATLIGTVQALTNSAGQFAATRASANYVLSILDAKSSITDTASRTLETKSSYVLRMQEVHFAYKKGRDILSGVSFEVVPGQTIALVGRSGGGKSTLANLLMRFYDPDQGSITLDGVDIRDYPVRDYRSLFAIVLQQPCLFNESIAANLRCAKKDSTDEEIIDALKRANAWEFVQCLPGGIENLPGDSGVRLSGGQRQRIAIARALISTAPFIILDEPTSALDAASEQTVQHALDALFSDRTVFVIAHRLSTIRKADRILVVNDGCIVEDGAYNELLERRGAFYELHRIAMGGSSSEWKMNEVGFA